jgi:hypothetical protein
LEATRPQANIIFMLANLKFAQMSGRVGKLQSALASLLNVQPIVRLENGLLDMTERVRTHKKAIERIIEMARERGQHAGQPGGPSRPSGGRGPSSWKKPRRCNARRICARPGAFAGGSLWAGGAGAGDVSCGIRAH